MAYPPTSTPILNLVVLVMIGCELTGCGRTEKSIKLMAHENCGLLKTLQLTADEAPDSELGGMAKKEVSRDP